MSQANLPWKQLSQARGFCPRLAIGGPLGVPPSLAHFRACLRQTSLVTVSLWIFGRSQDEVRLKKTHTDVRMCCRIERIDIVRFPKNLRRVIGHSSNKQEFKCAHGCAHAFGGGCCAGTSGHTSSRKGEFQILEWDGPFYWDRHGS